MVALSGIDQHLDASGCPGAASDQPVAFQRDHQFDGLTAALTWKNSLQDRLRPAVGRSPAYRRG